MLSRARSEGGIPVRADELDADVDLLNCLNGTIDLRSGTIRPHTSADLITKLAPVRFDPDARLALWDDFLETVTGGNADPTGFLRRAVGYALTGSTVEEKLFFAYGPSASGKSSFMEATKATLGDYAVTVDFESFLSRHHGNTGPRNDIARRAALGSSHPSRWTTVTVWPRGWSSS
jgi:putative DNA primase/helicase